MITGHLTNMKLFTATCHEPATLQKNYRDVHGKQFTAVTHKILSAVAPDQSVYRRWPDAVVAGISAPFSKFAFVLFCYTTNHFMTGPLGQDEFCFPRISICFLR